MKPTCQAIIAEFVYGPMRCGEPAVTKAQDSLWGEWFAVCANHAETPGDAA